MRQYLLNRSFFGAFLAIWIAGLCAGAHALWRYSATPGPAGRPSEHWPAGVAIQPQAGRATLVMLAHPRCPCTRASLSELERIVARTDADAWVLFLRPEGAEPGWEKAGLLDEGGLWASAAAIPGVRVLADARGTTAKAFGAETSGHVFLYDVDRVLRFSGGITAARGHEGPNEGGEAILAALRGGTSATTSTLTFGCPLHSNNSPR